MTSALLIIAAYLLGSLSGSLLLGRLRGVDIRTLGSGNAGGTNALRTQGWKFALGTVLVDVGKGVLAVWSASADRVFSDKVRKAGFKVEEVQVYAHGNKGTRHTIWIATK